jgi:hypothetical protein
MTIATLLYHSLKVVVAVAPIIASRFHTTVLEIASRNHMGKGHYDQLFVPMYDSLAALDACFRGVALSSLADWLKSRMTR